MIKKNIYIVVILLSFNLLFADQQIEVGIDEKLGNYLPMDLQFVNSEGDTVLLKEVITKPTLFSLVYYECPGICSPMLTEVSWVIDRVDLVPNVDFQAVSLSFDPKETPEIAARWKKNYLSSIRRNFPKESWTFLTGDSISIKKLTDAIGFYYLPAGKDYTHTFALITISPDGKISRYIYGQDYNQFDIKMALIDAESGKTTPTVAKVLQFCFSYDPEGRRYTLNVTRIVGTVMLISVFTLVGILTFKKKRTNKNKGANLDG